MKIINHRPENDPDLWAMENVAIAESIYGPNGREPETIADEDLYRLKVAQLVTDPWMYFSTMETGHPPDSKFDKIIRRSFFKRFLRYHPKYKDGYIAEPSIQREWRGWSPAPMGSWFKGIPLTEERKRQISIASRGKPRRKVACPKCGKVGGIIGISRWHGLNGEKCGLPQPRGSSATCPKCGVTSLKRIITWRHGLDGSKCKPKRERKYFLRTPEHSQFAREVALKRHARWRKTPELYKNRTYKMATCPKCNRTTIATAIKRWHGLDGSKCRW